MQAGDTGTELVIFRDTLSEQRYGDGGGASISGRYHDFCEYLEMPHGGVENMFNIRNYMYIYSDAGMDTDMRNAITYRRIIR